MRFVRVIALLVATGFFFGPLLAYAAGVRPVAVENRRLVSAPDFSRGWVAFDRLPTWASDHLVGRDRAIRANAWVDYRLFEEFPNVSTSEDLGPAVAGHTTSASTIPAPAPVIGRDGYVFLNSDFDIACRFGSQFGDALTAQSRLADRLVKAGKKVVLVVVPDKSSVAVDEVRDVVPTGACAQRALTSERSQLQGFSDPRSLDVYSALTAAQKAGDQPYWKTDSHWNSYGASLYARLLAARLSPAVADSLRFQQRTVQRVGDLMGLGGLNYFETAPAVRLLGRTVVEGPGTHFTERGTRPGTNTWTTTSAAPTIGGRTLIIGDSFSYYALGVIRPLFARGTFAWLGYTSNAAITEGIRRAATVIMEIVQRAVPGGGLASPSYVGLVTAGTANR